MKGFGQIKKMLDTQLQDVKARLHELRITGEAGGGLVKVTLDGEYACHGIELDDSLKNEDKAMVEDLIAAAFNAAQQRAKKAYKDQMSSMAQKMGLPPGFDLPGL